ncbi:MAG: DNA helicase RecQ [Proteobacteria bacterium]|nr:DNA helicase RecQ [Pseudomonadota bacterium]
MSGEPDQETILILRDRFGFDGFRPGQGEAIDALLAGRNMLAVMPTGSGKSLIYQVPALLTGGLSIVVSPLVALMQDQVAALSLNGIAAATINSSIPREANVDTWRRVQAGKVTLLYMSPERLMTGQMLTAVGKLAPKLFAIDEAHCISQWGPAFRPEYAELAKLRDIFPGVPIAALTATADQITRDDIAARLFDGDAEIIVTGFDRPNLTLAVEMKKSWKKQMVDFVAAHRDEAGIVYCLSRKKTEEAAGLLRDEGHKALAYHAGMEAGTRNSVQDRFMTEPGTVITATIAFGMGIDKPDIRYVFHTDLPGSPEAYYQEIGRAGRDGLPAETMMLYGLDDIRMRRTFIEQEDSPDDRKRREHKRLDALLAYCEAPECRRRMLLHYFGEAAEACGRCDLCLNPVETVDATEDGQKALSAVYRTGQRWGAAHIANVLMGKNTDKTASSGHDRLPTFGVGADRTLQEWNAMIRQLVASGFLRIDIQGYGGLGLAEKGMALLKGEGEFRFRPDTVQKAGRQPRGKNRAQAEALDPQAQELLLELKKLRLHLAQEREVPAYVIFSDKTLIDMAARRPANREAFAEVFGVGQAKLEQFADIFLEAIAGYEGG